MTEPSLLTCPVCQDLTADTSRVVLIRRSEVDDLHKCHRCGTVIIVPFSPEAAGIL